MRLTLSDSEVEELIQILKELNKDDLINRLNEEKEKSKKSKTNKKVLSAKNANAVKTKIAKDKIMNAINLMRLEGKKITVNSVAKYSGTSYSTVKKYNDFIVNQSS